MSNDQYSKFFFDQNFHLEVEILLSLLGGCGGYRRKRPKVAFWGRMGTKTAQKVHFQRVVKICKVVQEVEIYQNSGSRRHQMFLRRMRFLASFAHSLKFAPV